MWANKELRMMAREPTSPGHRILSPCGSTSASSLAESVAPPERSSVSETSSKASPQTSPTSRTLAEIFWEAMSEGNVDRVLDLVKMFGPELSNARTIYPHATPGQTPLHCASIASQEELVEGLISLGANVNAQDDLGVTPLHCAIVKKSLMVARILLQHGARVDIQDNDGHLPLHDAVWAGSLEAVELVLMDGQASTICTLDKRGRSPQLLAKKFKFNSAMDLFAEFRANQERIYGALPCAENLVAASSDGDGDEGESSQLDGSLPRASSRQGSQHESSQQGSSQRGGSQQELERVSHVDSQADDANPDSHGEAGSSSLERAGSCSGPTVSNLARNFDLDPLSMMEVAIAYSGMDSNCNLMLDLITTHGEEVAKYRAPRRGGQTCMHRAAHHGRLDVIRAALAANADIDAREDTYKSAPLAAAAAAGRNNVIEFLVREGADMEAMTDFGTAMHYAAYHGHRSTVRLLFDLGAETSVENAEGQTPRSLAKARGFSSIARILKARS